MSKKQKAPRSLVSSLVSRLVSKQIVFDLALASAAILAFALYQEAPPGTWALIKRLLGRW